VITGPANDFAGTGAMAATGDSGNNPNTKPDVERKQENRANYPGQ